MTIAARATSAQASVARADLGALVDRLVGLGLTQAVAEAYVRLTVMRGAKASELAAVMRVGRTEAYRLLQRLVEQRLAQMTMDRPIRFTAYPLDRVLEVMSDETRARGESLERARGELAQLIESLGASDLEADAPTFRVVKGRRQIHSELRRLVADARSSCVAVLADSQTSAAAAQAAIADAALARADDGVDVRILARGARDGRAPTPGCEVRAPAVAGSFLFAIADARELVALAVADARPHPRAENEIALVTSAPALVANHLALFEEWWPRGRRVA